MSEKWVRDTGVVFALVFLIVASQGYEWALVVSGIILVALLFAPILLKPLAKLWYLLAEVLGRIMNKVFFGLVFFVVIVPVGYCKRLVGGDMRDLHAQKARASAFMSDDRACTKELFTKPY